MSKPNPPVIRRSNSLGLDGEALENVLDSLDAAGTDEAAAKDRRHTRLSFRRDRLYLKVRQPGGQESIIKVACRNISGGGMCVLHSAYLHLGSPCAVVLEDLRLGQVAIYGDIVRCQHRRGPIHEIGIRFREPIDVRDFMPVESQGEGFNFERFEPGELEGCVVHVESSPLDARVVQHFLKDTRLRLRQAQGVDEALAMVREGCDLVLLETHLAGEDGETLLRQLRVSGDQTPVVVVTGDRSEGLRRRVLGLGAGGVVLKPIEQPRLLRAVAEYVISKRQRQELGESTRLSEQDSPSLSGEELRRELQAIAEELRSGLAERDARRCEGACFRALSAAPQAGRQDLAETAEQTARAISADGVESAVDQIQQLLDAFGSMLGS